jgi:hypothetical protein
MSSQIKFFRVEDQDLSYYNSKAYEKIILGLRNQKLLQKSSRRTAHFSRGRSTKIKHNLLKLFVFEVGFGLAPACY